MDQKTARKLFEKGAVFMFLGVPEGTEFGIDLKSWNTGEKFRGVKMIPPGIHYVFYSSVSKTGDTAPRVGFFYNFKQSEFLVKKWDKVLEIMSSDVIPEDEIVRLKDNIRALDSFLGPYPYDILNKWSSLTSHITESLAMRLMPITGQVQSALELESCLDADRPRGKNIFDEYASSSSTSFSKNAKRLRTANDIEDNRLPCLKVKEGTELRLTPLADRPYPEGSTPSEITKNSLDSSYVFDTLIATYSQPSDILGELEFCYICFYVGHSLEAFEHWKKLLGLFCSCEMAIKKYRKQYDSFISVIEIQIKEIPIEFLADIVSNNNYVYVKLRCLFRAIQTADIDGQLKCKCERLKKSLSDLYQWDFGHLDSDEEDEAPVIVEI